MIFRNRPHTMITTYHFSSRCKSVIERRTKPENKLIAPVNSVKRCAVLIENDFTAVTGRLRTAHVVGLYRSSTAGWS
jgi:hypothetical protein